MNLPVAELVGALPPGTRLHEYVLERVLGHGGFGITYLARDTHLDKPVAIKEYLPNDLAGRMPDNSVTARSNDMLEAFRWGLAQFVKEARVLARFSHPGLIQVHRYFEANGTAYFVMDYAEGVTLDAMLKAKSTIPETDLRKIIFPVLNGLEVVHRLGVLHRDIKPDNIILRQDGAQPVLIDFGAARNSLSHLTKSVMSVVTAGYAPLEHYGTDLNQGPWSDLYAMGAVAYRAVTGKKPADAVNRIRLDPVVKASVFGKGRYTPHFLAAIDWALAVDPEDRPQGIAEWRKALDGELTPPTRDFSKIKEPASEPTVDRGSSMARPRTLSAGATARGAQKASPNNSGSTAKPYAIVVKIAAGLAVLGVLTVLLSRGDPKPTTPVASAKKEAAVEPSRPPASANESAVTPVTEPTPAPTPAPAPAPAPISAPASAAKSPVIAPVPATKPKTEAATPEVELAAVQPTPQAKIPEAVVEPKAVVSQMEPLSSFQDCLQCPAMVTLPSGAFLMGSPPGAAGAANWEGPARRVSFAKPFAIGKFEVTTAEWQSCVRARACATLSASAGGPESSSMTPAVNVNWDEAQSYSNWLSKTTGRRYRLPSEAEWEYAIRGGTVSARFWGEDRRGQCEHANGADLSALKRDRSLRAGDQPCDDGHATLAPVGRFKPNAFGLHDLAGNAWEWTLDCWVDSYKGAPADGRAVDAPNCAKRVIRGGSWRTKPESLRSANRGLSPAGFRGDDVGFRVVAE